jgi:hypothetical protein
LSLAAVPERGKAYKDFCIRRIVCGADACRSAATAALADPVGARASIERLA